MVVLLTVDCGQVEPLFSDAIQPPPHWSSSPSFPRNLHHHHSLALYIFFFSSQYMLTPLQATFLHFLGYFTYICCPSNSFIPNSIHSSILTSSFPPHPTSSLVLSSLLMSRHHTSLLVLQPSCIPPLHPKAYSSVTQNH